MEYHEAGDCCELKLLISSQTLEGACWIYETIKDCVKLEDTVKIQERGGKILLIKYFVTIGLHKP